ncbi:hypothetical protein PsorP6_001077 [Peronosclerospora sorghi]|uniref:Uncharacterized protein n=1 Tax=Peronosclerospora sorghi TaxID=230839 RepID=A0ACC0WYZ3_9STRA|nr:hypothetical protein PsorP6_001077 [Peronosclerospora sorghi]
MSCFRCIYVPEGVVHWSFFRMMLYMGAACEWLILEADQFSVIEKLATEFCRDPFTFCWLDPKVQPADKRAIWKMQVRAAPTTPFVVALSYKGKKLALLPPRKSGYEDRHALEDDVRNWILRLLGGEVSQELTLSGLV